MDTLSSSISTFTIPKSNNNLKSHLHHHHRHPSLKPRTTKLPNKTTSVTTAAAAHNHPFPPHINSSRPPSPLKRSPSPHQRPSTGYAVALLDAARRHGAVDAVHSDVMRLSRWLRGDQLRRVMADPYLDMAAKGEIVKEVVKNGRLEKHLVKLVKLLADKGKVDFVGQVLSEFGKIYDELRVGGGGGGAAVAKNGHDQLLLLPSGVKMEENHVMAIVGKIQKLTGAQMVTVANYS